MLEEGIRGGICHAIPGHVKAYNKYMKGYGKNKKSLYLMHWNVNDLYGRKMSRKLPVDGLKWVENTSQFKKVFTEKYKGDIDEGYFLEVDVKYPEHYMNFIMIYPCILKEWKLKKLKNLSPTCTMKKEYVIHMRNLKQTLNNGFSEITVWMSNLACFKNLLVALDFDSDLS